MTTEEIERADAGTKKNYRVVYRHKTYEDGEKVIQSCILLPSGHPLFEVPDDREGLQSHFSLPLVDSGFGTMHGAKMAGAWWLIFGDKALSGTKGEELKQLSLEEIKTLAVPQIVAVLEAGERDPQRFSRRKTRLQKELEADA